MKSERLQSWGQIAEIVSGVAVVITLVFLAFEIRSNTNAVKIDTYDRLVADVANWQMMVATNNELGEAIAVGGPRADDLRSDYQNFIVNRSAQSLWIIYERAFLQWEAGNISDVQFGRFRSQICTRPIIGTSLDASLRRNTSASFTTFRDECRSD